VLMAIFNGTAGIASSSEQRDVLLTAATQQRIEGAARDAYLAAARSITGGSERAAALAALLVDPAAAAPPAAPATRARASSAAPGVTQTVSSSIHNHDGDDGEWSSEIVLNSSDGSRTLRANVRGAHVGASHSDVRSIERGGYVRIEERKGAVLRRLEIVPGANATLVRRYSVDGRAQPFDDAVQRWFAGLVREFTGD
jgi:hypothetical protein